MSTFQSHAAGGTRPGGAAVNTSICGAICSYVRVDAHRQVVECALPLDPEDSAHTTAMYIPETNPVGILCTTPQEHLKLLSPCFTIDRPPTNFVDFRQAIEPECVAPFVWTKE